MSGGRVRYICTVPVLAKRLPYAVQCAVERLPQEQQRFVVEYATEGFEFRNSCVVAGVKQDVAKAWLTTPEVQTAISLITNVSMHSVGISLHYLLSAQKEILERCMQHRPVIDKKGQVVEGEWTFDAFNANKSIENLGKLTGHLSGGGVNLNVNITGLSQSQREMELNRILNALEARQTAGESIIEAEFKELPSEIHEEPLFD